MRWGVVVFPGSNDDRDALRVAEKILGDEAVALWHKDRDLRGADVVILPGGFSYGDYLRCGALVRNRSLLFVCDTVTVRVEHNDTPFTVGCRPGELLSLPIKHGEGCYVA